MMERKDKNYIIGYGIVLISIVTVLIISGLGDMYGIFFPPDEYGYWANAAVVNGYDWREVSALQPYYAWGYSLLLSPLMYLFRDPITMYRAAIVLNGLLAAVHGLLLLLLLYRLFPGREKKGLLAVSMVGSLYPSVLIYMHYTIAETLLSLLFLIACLLLLRLLERPCMLRLLWLAVCTAFLFATHMRTLGLAAAFAVAVWMRIYQMETCRRALRRLAVFLLALLFIAGVWLFLSNNGGAAARDYFIGQLGKLQKLCGLRGAADFAAGFLGKIFYLGVATWGTAYWGIYFILKQSVEAIRGCRQGTAESGQLFYLCFGFGLLFTLMISTVYFMGGTRMDQLIYGRYSETLVPLLLCIGLLEMKENRHLWNGTMGIVIFHCMAAALLHSYAKARGIDIYMRDFITGASWYFGKNSPYIKEVFMMPAIASAFFSSLAAALMYLTRRGKSVMLPGAMAAIYLGIGVYMTHLCVYSFHEADKSDVELIGLVKELREEGRELYFLDSLWSNYIDLLQFHMPEEPVRITGGLSYEAYFTPQEAIVITYPNYEVPEQLERYQIMLESEHFRLYFNP